MIKNLLLLGTGIGLGAVGMLKFVACVFGFRVRHLRKDDGVYELKGMGKYLIIINSKREPRKKVDLCFTVDKELFNACFTKDRA